LLSCTKKGVGILANDEVSFRQQLAKELSKPPFNHKVYFHEAPNEFSIHGARGWVDLYVETNQEWEHHDKFPVIGIETKIAKSMGWLIDAIEQVDKYNGDLKTAKYTIQGKEIRVPELFLVVTPDSWQDGFIYEWTPAELQGQGEKAEAMRWGSWFSLTILYERLLMKHGATVLRKEGVFYTNLHGNHGAVTRYRL